MQKRGDTRRNCLRISRRECTGCKAKARLRLEMASDRLARQLLNMTSDPNVADPVKLAAIKDALDRGGIQAKTAVSVEVSTKPFEIVFDAISSGPRDPTEPALAELPAAENDEIIGEIDEDPEDEFDGEPLRIQQRRESADVVDVEVVVDTGYTDDPGTTTPDDPSSSLSVDLSGPLGMRGPAGSGLMSLSDAVATHHNGSRMNLERMISLSPRSISSTVILISAVACHAAALLPVLASHVTRRRARPADLVCRCIVRRVVPSPRERGIAASSSAPSRCACLVLKTD